MIKTSLALIFFLIIFSGRAQNFSNPVTLNYESVALEDILDDLNSKFQLQFSYGNQKIPLKKEITISATSLSLYTFLGKLFGSVNVEYRIIGGNVVLRENQRTNSALITGKVTDENGNSVPFVHVTNSQDGSGVVTNEEGEFLYWVDNTSDLSLITFSSIGFKHKSVPLKNFNDEHKTIVLEDAVVTLSEVVVNSDNAKQLVIKALENKKVNLPNVPYLMEGFYRTSYKEGNEYVSLLEAALKIYDKDFFQKNRLSIIAQTIRKSNDYREYKWDESSNYLSHFLLNTDLIRNNEGALSKQMIDVWDFEIGSTDYLGGNVIYKIVADLKQFEDDSSLLFKAEIYLRDEDFAIFQMDYEYRWDSKYSQRRVSKNIALKSTGVKVSTRYRSFEGKMFLSYQSREGYMNVYDRKTNNFLEEITISDEFIANDVRIGVPEPYGKRLGRIGDIHEITTYYSVKFWENYNIPMETRLFQKIKNDLEKRQPLEEQFQQNASIVLN